MGKTSMKAIFWVETMVGEDSPAKKRENLPQLNGMQWIKFTMTLEPQIYKSSHGHWKPVLMHRLRTNMTRNNCQVIYSLIHHSSFGMKVCSSHGLGASKRPVAAGNPGSSKVVDKSHVLHISSLKVASHLSKFQKFTSWKWDPIIIATLNAMQSANSDGYVWTLV